MCVVTRADLTTGAFGGAPYGGTKRVRDVPKWTRVRMRTLPLEPSVELPMGPRTVWGVCPNGPEYACGPCHWSLRWGSLWGHEACEGCAEMKAELHANPALRGHETCEGCADMRVEVHVNPATGAFSGVPYGATNRVRCVPTWEAGANANVPS